MQDNSEEAVKRLRNIAKHKARLRFEARKDQIVEEITGGKKKKRRVIKPKPKRRPVDRVTTISLAGEPVEGLEYAFINLD